MGLRDEQMAFAKDVVKLLIQAEVLGYEVTLGEVQRAVEMQQMYVQAGRSKTMNSMHLKKCAIDLNLFRNGRLCTRDEIRPLGEFWEALHEKNRWGGNWRGLVDAGKSRFVDAPHFERQV